MKIIKPKVELITPIQATIVMQRIEEIGRTCYLKAGSSAYLIWKTACESCEFAYLALLDQGCTPQEARSVLPNSLKTELVMTANIREWRHFLKLRCSKAARPQIREVAIDLRNQLIDLLPHLFEDLVEVD